MTAASDIRKEMGLRTVRELACDMAFRLNRSGEHREDALAMVLWSLRERLGKLPMVTERIRDSPGPPTVSVVH
jgi:hypothetical protein